MSKSNIVIVGGGNAGLSVASQLLLKNKNLHISIIDPATKHYYQPAWTLVGAGIFDINETEKNEADYIPKGTTWIKESVIAFQPENNKVSLSNGKDIEYDVLVVCPGIQLDWNKIKGLKEAIGKNNVSCNYDFHSAPYTWEMIKNFKGGTAIFTNPTSPIKCGGAPHKIMYLAVDYWRKKGILDKCNVHYLSGAGVIFGVKEYAETLTQVVKDGNIKPHFGVNVVEVDSVNQTVTFETKEGGTSIKDSSFAGCYGVNIADENAETKRVTLKFDLCHAVPPQSAPDFIKSSPLSDANNPYGYVEINKNTMQHSRYPNVFSLGDCTNAPCSKTGAAIRKQAPVVVENILSFINNSPLKAMYTGYSACPIPTKYGKLMLAEFDYTNTPTMTFPFNQAKPRWSMWILKTKILPWLYWNKILTGKA
ncbi:MAG TPA: FAD/NAD(P)-binding oxidoreductase [Chitinophagaceae bacterium]|nr:FAD/NAD(P)-binding oxidoreductase [Chitinophagaceae bacterium]